MTFLVMKPCNLVGEYQRFGGKKLSPSSILKIEVVCSLETLATTYEPHDRIMGTFTATDISNHMQILSLRAGTRLRYRVWLLMLSQSNPQKKNRGPVAGSCEHDDKTSNP
jgi:hypothetical protein